MADHQILLERLETSCGIKNLPLLGSHPTFLTAITPLSKVTIGHPRAYFNVQLMTISAVVKCNLQL